MHHGSRELPGEEGLVLPDMVLSMHFSEELAREVLRSGLWLTCSKSDADEELLAAVDHDICLRRLFSNDSSNIEAVHFRHG